MVNIKLKKSELKFLTKFIRKGQKNARSLTRARILLLANQGKGDTEIAEILGVGRYTALRIRKRYLEEGLQSALVDKPRTGQPEKYSEKHKADIPQMFAKIQQFFTLSFFLKIAFPIQAYFLEISHTFWSCTFNESF